MVPSEYMAIGIVKVHTNYIEGYTPSGLGTRLIFVGRLTDKNL